MLAAGCCAIVLFCAVRAVVEGYVPLDDNAVTETRARDVFSAGIPLIGTVSSVTQLGSGTVNHPGPMLFDILAVPVRLLPAGSGVAIGVAVVHMAVIVTLAWSARRLLGEQGACVVMMSVAVMLWSFGSETWFEVWQPVVTMLPFLLVLVAAWGWAAGHDELAVPAVVSASFVVQTHGSYLLLGPTVVASALVCRLAIRDRAPVARRPLAVATAVGAVLWARPVVDQLFGSHNMSALVRQAIDGQEGRSLGLVDATRAAATVLVSPPWWLRSGVGSSLPNSGGLVPSPEGPAFDPDWVRFPVAAAGMVALIGLLVALAVVFARRRDRVVAAGAVIGIVAVVTAAVTLAGLPIDAFGFTAHKARWLWPIGAYVTAFGVVGLLRSGFVASTRQASTASALLGAVALAATVPVSTQLVSPQQYMVASYDSASDLRTAVRGLEGRGVVFLDLSDRPFPDPFNDTVAAAMAAGGISFRVDGDYVVAQYGDDRALDADEADVTVRTFVGTEAADLPEGWSPIADVDGWPRVVLAVHDGVVTRSGPSG